MQGNEPISMVQYAFLRLSCNRSIPMRYGHHLRGWLIERFPKQSLVSHHENTGRSIYMYPRIQSKIVGGEAVILGIEEGVDYVNEIATNPPRLITLNREDFTVSDVHHEETVVAFGVVKSAQEYKFVTPWLALNQENYEHYLHSTGKERYHLLSTILIGNVLSAAKSLGIVLSEQIKIRSFLKPFPVHFKGKSMIGFSGTFSANLYLPNLIGLGKSVSRGFGTVVKVEQKSHQPKEFML